MMVKREKSKRFFLFIGVIVLVLITGVTGAAASGEQRFVVSVDNVANYSYTDSGAFKTPAGSSGPGPALPGSAYQWTFYGAPGDKLSFATMLVSNERGGFTFSASVIGKFR